jgi:hypothetical protein
MLLDWGIINNIFNCADIQISIELELKILEQIHHLNIWWIQKGGLILLEKTNKFPKNPSWHECHKSGFSWDQLHVRKGVTIQVQNGVVWEK